jgi:bifunctional non-homologous end joining protein LigD
MLAVPTTDLPPDDARWAYEMKWDGMRALVGVERGEVWAASRAGNDATARFPELAGLADALGDLDALLDGEIVALDDAGVPRFERLQPRMQAGSAAAIRRGVAEQAVVYMVFDVLWLDGHSTCELPYTDRRAVLERLGLAGPAWQTPPTAYGAGAHVLESAGQLGLEGVVAKRRDSTYLAGKRSDAWRKIKPTLGQELVVGGWLPGAGRLENRLGSLLVGYHDVENGRAVLRFAGRVGSGINGAHRNRLEALLRPLRRPTSPFVAAPRLPDAVWVEPQLVVEVAFHEWTSAGVLRAPRYRGQRDDKPAGDVVRET